MVDLEVFLLLLFLGEYWVNLMEVDQTEHEQLEDELMVACQEAFWVVFAYRTIIYKCNYKN